MSTAELQEEEIEVLRSIYDGDSNFKEISANVFQYKIGTDSDLKSFVIEIQWSADYPAEMPKLNLDLFYNKHLSLAAKSSIENILLEQAESMLGMAMTYSLIEYAKEHLGDLLANYSEAMTKNEEERVESRVDSKAEDRSFAKPKEKKEQLSKTQKRKLVNRQDINGEKPRGWDWVDVIKHLCQTGKQSADFINDKT